MTGVFSISDSHDGLPSWLSELVSTECSRVMFTSRGHCGSRPSAYEGFNLCHYTGDDQRHISESRRLLADELGISDEALIVPRQTHSFAIRVITSVPVAPKELDGVDGLVTGLRGVAIGVSTADCVPVVAVDDSAGIIGVAHAGWRGALGGVVQNLFDEMLGQGASIGGLRTFFGPSICCSCFEVGEEVASLFPENCVLRKPEWIKPHVDLQGYLVGIMSDFGLVPSQISEFTQSHCTRCCPGRYFSARALGVNSGRNFTFAILK